MRPALLVVLPAAVLACAAPAADARLDPVAGSPRTYFRVTPPPGFEPAVGPNGGGFRGDYVGGTGTQRGPRRVDCEIEVDSVLKPTSARAAPGPSSGSIRLGARRLAIAHAGRVRHGGRWYQGAGRPADEELVLPAARDAAPLRGGPSASGLAVVTGRAAAALPRRTPVGVVVATATTSGVAYVEDDGFELDTLTAAERRRCVAFTRPRVGAAVRALLRSVRIVGPSAR